LQRPKKVEVPTYCEQIAISRYARDFQSFEAVAFQGKGVFESLKEVARLVLIELKKG